MFDDAARQFKKKKTTVTLGGTVKQVFIVPVLLYMKGDHKSHQINTCRYGNNNSSICITCKYAPAWEADNEAEVIGEPINALSIHEQNLDYESINEQIDVLQELIAEPDCEEKQQKKEELKIKCASITSLDENIRKHYITPCLNSFEEFSHIATSIYYCSPPDHLHVFLLGVLKSAAEATIGIWPNSNKNKLDILARTIIGKNSSTV